jgi:glycosyltransferase involved in cell wall biosynthesis
VIDPSHSSWILGGMFKEASRLNAGFQNNFVEVSNLKNRKTLVSLIKIALLTAKKSPLLFTSVTPLQNFNKLNPYKTNLKALFYTHNNRKLLQSTINLLNKVDIIFCMNSKEKTELAEYGVRTPIHNITGAIDPNRFSTPALPGSLISWVGTATMRKNPHIFLDFVKSNPQLKFRLLGKNWRSSSFFEAAHKLKNLEYKEITGALTSKDFNECSHYLCLSSLEGGPMPLLEAVAAGLIPISTNVGFAPELLAEFGYKKQLIGFPIKFEEIILKYSQTYTTDHIIKARDLAKNYSLNRFSNYIQSEIKILGGDVKYKK